MIQPDFNKSSEGLVPAIAQDFETGEVLMLAYVNEAAWNQTVASGHATYWSRSRNQLWTKGESSGNLQIIKDILLDCDDDAIIYKVEQIGEAACHTGYRSCFYRRLNEDDAEVIAERIFDPHDVYKT